MTRADLSSPRQIQRGLRLTSSADLLVDEIYSFIFICQINIITFYLKKKNIIFLAKQILPAQGILQIENTYYY